MRIPLKKLNYFKTNFKILKYIFTSMSVFIGFWNWMIHLFDRKLNKNRTIFIKNKSYIKSTSSKCFTIHLTNGIFCTFFGFKRNETIALRELKFKKLIFILKQFLKNTITFDPLWLLGITHEIISPNC